ncbi:unnamed protein product [Adineta ricciae]|uniref:Uncharacterized protein n=1 Tax=Adineta ricciae TaxID=249248 RepID=A0A814HWK1_ADIRI|nr:unnamed protein product [Adineta ricciae]
MPIEIGLLSTQQDSFDQHEELSKLLTETDVFYVPLRNELSENRLNAYRDLTDLTKRFDEDLSNKHLVVTFRDIGYSLFLDSVQSVPDESDQSKIKVSGKMIVDGICIQFLGCFDYNHTDQKQSSSQIIQINGVGRVQLDEGYYRELSSAQTLPEHEVKEDDHKEETTVKSIVKPKTRSSTTKTKDKVASNRPKTRSTATNEVVVPKEQTNRSDSPPANATLPQQSHSSTSTTRPRMHSPIHMPYPHRSPRTKQHRALSPVHFINSSISTLSEGHSSRISTSSSIYPDYSQLTPSLTTSQSIEYSHAHRLQTLSQQPHFPSPTIGQSTIPIQIPTPSNTILSPGSLPQLTSLFLLPQSQSLPTYILPNFSNLTTGAAPSATNPSGTPFDFTPIPSNTSLLLIANPNQHPTQPIHILTPIDHRSLQFAHYTTANIFSQPPFPSHTVASPTSLSSRISNILQPTLTNDSLSMFHNKRHDSEEEKHVQQPIDSSKQSTGQLPFKKRRYTGHQTRMANVHNDDDDVSDESVKK